MSGRAQLAVVLNFPHRLRLFLTLILVLFVYKFSTVQQVKESSKHGPNQSFSDLPSFNIHDIMKTYAKSDFNYKNKGQVRRHILFWNEAYGSKDYGIKLNVNVAQSIDQSVIRNRFRQSRISSDQLPYY